MSASSSMTVREAFAELGLSEPASPDAVKAAFKSSVKAARPDQGEGDPDRFRRVIEAYRLLQKFHAARAALTAPPAPATEAQPEPAAPPHSTSPPSPPPVLEISVMEAVIGLARQIRLSGDCALMMRLPGGLRQDDIVRVKGKGPDGGPLLMRVRILAEPNRAVSGDHLYLTVAVDPRALTDGGRVEIDTPRGVRSVWIPRGFPADGKLRLRGEGLPCRGAAPEGDLFVRPVAAEVAAAPARERLDRFARAWTSGGGARSTAHRNGL